MFAIYKLLRGLIRAIFSTAAPWQVAIAAFLGVMLGLLPLRVDHMLSPLWLAIFGLALVINCHFGSVLVFMLAGKLLSLVLKGPAVALGEALDGFTRSCADITVLRLSGWSNTGRLGLTLFGLILAPIAAVVMYRVTIWVRTKLKERLLANQRLLKAGKLANKAWMVRAVCWFFGL